MPQNALQRDSDPAIAAATAELRSAGLKVTAPRVAILTILEAADPHHLSAEDVYRNLLEQGTDTGLATVYRVLTQFEEAGLVCRHHFDSGQAVFERDTGDDHNHIVCTRTGKVAEFTDRRLEKRLEAIARELGYELTDHKIILHGVYASRDDTVADDQPKTPHVKRIARRNR